MALQICPNCKAESFTWSYNEEDTPPTTWGCNDCGYFAREDESFERICETCNRKTESRLEDEQRIYWWCSSCNKTTEISQK